MKSFITGSYAYGTPTEESDIDLVIYIAKDDKELLINKSDKCGFPIRYNKLNLIVCETPKKFYLWKLCTDKLVEESPVTRKAAIEFIVQTFKDFGIGLKEDIS